jgi:hypothetical protein
LQLAPGSGESLASWLDEIAVDTRFGAASPFRYLPSLVRRRDPAGGEYFLLARPGRLWGERYYLSVDGDIVSVTQVLPAGQRGYLLFFVWVSVFAGLGGLIGGIVTGHLSTVWLLVFPVFMRLWIVPMMRDYQRGFLTEFLTNQTPIPAAEPALTGSARGRLQRRLYRLCGIPNPRDVAYRGVMPWRTPIVMTVLLGLVYAVVCWVIKAIGWNKVSYWNGPIVTGLSMLFGWPFTAQRESPRLWPGRVLGLIALAGAIVVMATVPGFGRGHEMANYAAATCGALLCGYIFAAMTRWPRRRDPGRDQHDAAPQQPGAAAAAEPADLDTSTQID